ncbi:MAG: S1 RNA-binding domain-containing protein [Anaerolineaceae bacterium]|jgi:predicted RNA-binding protein with RPS1 domain|nr:S1 RNA-binding domain-containing protein [Anaerolineaceae bacterium]
MESNIQTESGAAAEVQSKMQFTGKVIKTSLAGAVVDIGTEQPAVLHVSQVNLGESSDDSASKRVEDVLAVGQEVNVWVRRVKEDHIELTMNEPLALEWREIKKGMTVKGTVVRLEKFGAFVEIGAERPGLVHISEMAHGYVKTPGDMVKVGDEVEAQVLDVQRRKKQIKLSMKATQPAPEPEQIADGDFVKTKGKKRSGGKRGDKRRGGEAQVYTISDSNEPQPTAMELALRSAMDQAKERESAEEKADKKSKKQKTVSQVQDDILTRTLESKETSED